MNSTYTGCFKYGDWSHPSTSHSTKHAAQTLFLTPGEKKLRSRDGEQDSEHDDDGFDMRYSTFLTLPDHSHTINPARASVLLNLMKCMAKESQLEECISPLASATFKQAQACATLSPPYPKMASITKCEDLERRASAYETNPLPLTGRQFPPWYAPGVPYFSRPSDVQSQMFSINPWHNGGGRVTKPWEHGIGQTHATTTGPVAARCTGLFGLCPIPTSWKRDVARTTTSATPSITPTTPTGIWTSTKLISYVKGGKWTTETFLLEINPTDTILPTTSRVVAQEDKLCKEHYQKCSGNDECCSGNCLTYGWDAPMRCE